MVEEEGSSLNILKAEDWLTRAQELIPVALSKARQVQGFSSRWKMIISKLERLPSRLSDLSSHPCFSKNTLCMEQLQSVVKTLNEAIHLAELCTQEKIEGKLHMQSNLDSLSGKLDLNLQDCGVLIKTGVLSEVTCASSYSPPSTNQAGNKNPKTTVTAATHGNIRELLARLQIGHLESKHKALNTLLDIMKEDEKTVMSSLGKSNISALISLLTATSPSIQEKAITVLCSLAESGCFESWVVSEGALPPLIKLVESGGPVAREKATISLQRLSMSSSEIVQSIAGHGGIRPLLEACQSNDSVCQAASTSTLKNLSTVPEVLQVMAEAGAVRVMIDLIDHGLLLGSKEYAAECLQNLTSSNEELRKSVVAEGGIRSLLAYIDGPKPQESAVGTLKNLVGSVSMEVLDSLGFLPRIVHVLKSGSVGAQQAAAGALCKVCASNEDKKTVAEAGCVPLLVRLLEAKSNGAREVAAQALSTLMVIPQIRREVRRDERSVPSFVHLLDPGPHNTAKKYAVMCLEGLSSSRKCRRVMVSYGAIGYLKKLTEMDVPGAKKLLERLERGRLTSLLFSIK